jgi:hypothetical protein
MHTEWPNPRLRYLIAETSNFLVVINLFFWLHFLSDNSVLNVIA